MATKSPDRRRTLVILPDLQKRIIARASFVPAAALILLGAAVSLHCVKVITEAAANDVDLPGLRFLLPSILGFVFAMAGLLVRQAIHFSNHIGGPAYRIARSMALVRDGQKVNRIKLRDGDYLVEVAEQLNELMEWINSGCEVETAELDDEATNDDEQVEELAEAEEASTLVDPEVNGKTIEIVTHNN